MRKSSKRSKKGTDKLLGVLAVDAFISLVPSLGFYLYLYAYKPPVEGNSDATIQDVLEALYVTSAYSMPLIHLAFNPYIRKDFLLLFQRLRCKKTAEVIKKFPDNQSKRPTIATVTDNIV
ncbi:uncharacterized protein [Watersipora subatra]|uniref:uncharacterized protein n=1 Tax=Watersipora subatra TaxID=2589382 RepID=UPI00355B8D70